MNLTDIPLETLSCSGVYEITDGPNKGKLGVFIGDLQFVKGAALAPGEAEHITAGLDHIADEFRFASRPVWSFPGTMRFENVAHLRYRGDIGGETGRWINRVP